MQDEILHRARRTMGGLSRRMIAYYASGEKPIPKTVLLATEGWRVRERSGRKRVSVAEEGAKWGTPTAAKRKPAKRRVQ